MSKVIPTAKPGESDESYVARCAAMGVSLDDLDDFFEAELPSDDGTADVMVSTFTNNHPAPSHQAEN